MMLKDTPPASPVGLEEYGEEEEEEMVYIGDVDEVVEALEGDADVPEGMEEDAQEQDDSISMFKLHKGSVFCGSLSKDCKYSVTGGEDDKAFIWDTSTGEIVFECTGHKDSVIFADFNQDNSYVATGDMSGVIKLWKISDKSLEWEYNMGDATWMKWHTIGNILLAGSVEGEVYMWKVPEGDCKVLQGYGHRAETGVLMPDGKRLVVGYEDGAIRIIDLKTCLVLTTILAKTGHAAAITALDCHSDNNLILSAAVDGKTILSTTQTGKIISVLQDLGNSKEDNDQAGVSSENKGGNWVEAVAFSKDPALHVACSGTLNGDIFIWDTAKQVLRHKIEQESGISKLVWKGSSSIFFSAGLDGILRCFDARSGQHLQSLFGHSADILDLYISVDGSLALTASDDSTARIFNISN